MKLAAIGELKRVALRNLARHKMKTFLTCAAIMVSVTVYIWMDSWIGGLTMESRRNVVNYEIGAAKLQTKLYFEKKDELPSYENFDGWETYARILDEAGYHTAPRYVFSGTIYSLMGSAPAVVNAVDPAAEARVLGYSSYIELGRYIRAGEFGIVLGAMTAEKLKVGIPTRLTVRELDELVEAASPAEAAFIRSCYQAVAAAAQFGETQGYAEERTRGRVALKRDIPRSDLDRLWALLDATGRNDVRISTVIDYKLAPEAVGKDKWDVELWPLLSGEEQRLLGAAYEFDSPTGSYLLAEADAAKLDAVLQAMIRADFSGAVRHVSQVIDAKVVGMVNSPDPFTNYNIAYMPLDVLQDEAGMMLGTFSGAEGQGAVTELLIRDKAMGPADMTSPKESKEAIRAALVSGLAERGSALPEDLDVFFWMDYMAEYLGLETLESGATKFISILLFLLAVIGISNTMLLAILERTREIGMMRALGMTDGQMVMAYVLEAGFLGFIGSLMGIVLGCLINIPMVKYGIDFSDMIEQMGGDMGFRVAGNFRGTWKIGTIISSGIIATVLSAFMAFLPTRRANKMAITDSLRFE